MLILTEAQLNSDPCPEVSTPRKLGHVYAGVLSGRRLLIVEDSPDNQLLISMFLRPTAAVVSLADDGQAGVELAKTFPFDLVLMDIQMPKLDGHQAIRKMREFGVTTPVVAMTAHAIAHERSRCLESGFSAYLAKPLDRRLLIETILNLLLAH